MTGYIKLDPISEWLVLSTSKNTKNVVVLAGEYMGRTDEEIRRKAVLKAMEQHPRLEMRVKEIRDHGKHYLVWSKVDHPKPPIVITDIRSGNVADDSFGILINTIKTRLECDWNLFEEPPWEYHVIRLEDERQISALIMHHAIAAAVDGSSIIASIGANYLELKTGKKPRFPESYEMVSTATKRKSNPERIRFRDRIYKNLLKIGGLGKSPALPMAAGDPRGSEQRHFKRVLSTEETERLLGKAKTDQAGVVDYLLAATNMAVDLWNEPVKNRPGLIRTYATINLKGTDDTIANSNSIGFLVIKTKPSERNTGQDLVKRICRKRIKQAQRQVGIKSYQNIEFMVNLIRHGPLSWRRRVVSAVMNRNRFSMGITYMGRILISDQDEADPNSFSASQPGLEVVDVHGFGHKLVPGAPLVFTFYIFRGRLQMIASISAKLFKEAAAISYSDHVIDSLRSIIND
jgi:NRPS condensation-like uncharacterized protein